jgi:hypothetical protein
MNLFERLRKEAELEMKVKIGLVDSIMEIEKIDYFREWALREQYNAELDGISPKDAHKEFNRIFNAIKRTQRNAHLEKPVEELRRTLHYRIYAKPEYIDRYHTHYSDDARRIGEEVLKEVFGTDQTDNEGNVPGPKPLP